MINTENIKLGKKLKVTDVRTFKLAKYLKVAAPLPAPPSEVSYVTRVPNWKMNLNDQLGDCVPAAMAHTVQQMTFFSRGLSGMIVPTDQDVLTAYQRIGGYIPGRPETDNGCDMLTALKYWRRVGIANHKILAFMEINPKNLIEVQTAIWMFGSVFTGLQLPISVQPLDQWIVPDGGTYTSIGRPSGWGGHCLHGETKIPLLSGESIAIRDMIPGNQYWVYSWNGTRLVPGRATALGRTRELAKTVNVTLDNGEIVRCTEDHPFMLRDGTYRKAEDLCLDDSLMPLYRKISDTEAYPGYEQWFNPNTNRWIYTHRTVAGNLLKLHKGEVAHHIDFNKRNNSPTNLQVMSWDDHTKLHAENSVGHGLLNYAQSLDGRAKSRELMNRLWANPEWKKKQIEKRAEGFRQALPRLIASGQLGVLKTDSEVRRQNGLRMVENLRNNRATPEAIGNGIRQWFSNASKEDLERRKLVAMANLAKSPSHQKSLAANNHKVVSVEISEPADVYDITVDQWHNFAIDQGIFVHNCVPFFAGSPLTLTCVTWGMMLKSSHNFWLDYVDEAYVVLSMDWINSVTNLAVNGFNLDQLQNDLSQL